MARPDATALPQPGSRTGGLLDPARPSHRWWVAATVLVSGFLVSMSQTAVQVALPQIMTVFGLNLEQAQWIVTAYIIAGSRAGASGRLARQLAREPHVLPAGSDRLRDQLGPLCHLLEWPVAHHLPGSPGPWRQPHPAHDHDVLEQRVPPCAAGHGHGLVWYGVRPLVPLSAPSLAAISPSTSAGAWSSS